MRSSGFAANKRREKAYNISGPIVVASRRRAMLCFRSRSLTRFTAYLLEKSIQFRGHLIGPFESSRTRCSTCSLGRHYLRMFLSNRNELLRPRFQFAIFSPFASPSQFSISIKIRISGLKYANSASAGAVILYVRNDISRMKREKLGGRNGLCTIIEAVLRL